MGFGGGGSAALPAHQHTNVPLTGGPLDLSGVTVGSLAAGSVVYSNGAALQELLKPAVPAGEVLSYPALAVAPSWIGAGAAVTTNVQTQSSNVADTSTSLTFVDTLFTKTLAGAGAGTCNTVYNYVIENTNNYALRWSYSTDGDQAEFRPLGQINYPNGNCYSANTTTLGSQVCKVQMRMTAAGTITLQPYSSVYFQSTAYWTEIS